MTWEIRGLLSRPPALALAVVVYPAKRPTRRRSENQTEDAQDIRGAKGIPTRVGKLWKGLVPPVALGEEACAGAVLRSRFWGELG